MSPSVLLLTPDYPPKQGGIARLLGRVAAHVEDHELDVVTFRAPRGTAAGEVPPAWRPLPEGGPRTHKYAVAALNGAMVGRGVVRRPHLVMCGHVTVAPAALALARFARLPFLFWLYADEMRVRPELCRRAIAGAARVIVISEHTRRLALALGADPARMGLVHPGVDLPPRWSAERSGPPLLVTVGRLEAAHKGHAVVLRALPAIRAAVPDARWVAIGGGPAGPLRELARELDVEDAVTFTGAVGDDERDALLESARVFVMPSRVPEGGVGGEGFGIVYLEASAHGLPVVGANEGGAVDAVVEGETGDLVDPTDPAAVADAVIALLRDPDRSRAYGVAGRAYAERHSWPLTAAAVERELGAALAASRPA